MPPKRKRARSDYPEWDKHTTPEDLAKARFAEGEQVLVFHKVSGPGAKRVGGVQVYDGKIVKVQFKPYRSTFLYLVHFTGWKKCTDEYIEQTLVMKYNKENLELQRKVKEAYEEDVKKNIKTRLAKSKALSLIQKPNGNKFCWNSLRRPPSQTDLLNQNDVTNCDENAPNNSSNAAL